jgi:hypothetical protein
VILAMFPSGLRFETEAMTTEGERIAAQASGRGEHVNVRLYSNTYHRLFVIRDGKIQILKEYMDTAIAGELLGHEGPPKASARRAPRLKDPAGLFLRFLSTWCHTSPGRACLLNASPDPRRCT